MKEQLILNMRESISEYLFQNRISITSFGTKSGLTQGNLRRIMYDPKINPTLETLEKLCNALGNMNLQKLLKIKIHPDADRDQSNDLILINEIFFFLMKKGINNNEKRFLLAKEIYSISKEVKNGEFDQSFAELITRLPVKDLDG